MPRFSPSLRTAAAGLFAMTSAQAVHADQAPSAAQELPPITVIGDRASLTVPTTDQATAAIALTPGAVEVVPDTAFKNTPAQTIKDILANVPGVTVQNRWGPDARLSIRGSGLTRSYGNRGLNLYFDGVPVNTADGLFDLFEVDPSAYRYVEVYKGANALRYGANALGGAINFVTPTGRDAAPLDARLDGGSFGWGKGQASSGGASGPLDYFATASGERWDGYRAHSSGDDQRLSGNLGYRLSADAETRFYLNANTWHSRLPGEVTKAQALEHPRDPESDFVLVDQQRNVNSARLSNKTTLRLGATTLDIGAFGFYRHVRHPIYQWLDFNQEDYGGFLRATDERSIAGLRNHLIAGVNVDDGSTDNHQYENLPGAVKGVLLSSNVDTESNYSAYFEESLYLRPDLALIAGAQAQHSGRKRRDRFLSDGDQSGSRSFDIFSPRGGLRWDLDPDWQIFANLSRSAEVPSYDVNSFSSPASSNVDAQRATTYELGSRGQRARYHWDLAFYRAEIDKELQCLTLSPYNPCTVVNADRTVHQGIEAGFGFALAEALATAGDGLWLDATYDWNDFRFRHDATYHDNRLPGVPVHFVRAELLYRHPDGLSAGPIIERVVKPYFADNANQLSVDPYTLVNLRIAYEHDAHWSSYVEGRNLFDTRYIASTVTAGSADASSELFNPGTGISFYGGLRYRW